MDNKVKLSDSFISIEEILNPRITFDGEFSIYSGFFYAASKKEKDKNWFDSFLNKNYYQKIENYFSKSIASPMENYLPNFTFAPQKDEMGGGRYFHIDISFFLQHLLVIFNIANQENLELLASYKTIEERMDFVKLKLKYLRKEYREVLNLQEKSAIYELLMKEMDLLRKKYPTKFITIENYVIEKVQILSKVIVNMKSIIDVFLKPLSMKEFADCFDKDKFYLVYGECLNRISKEYVEKYGGVHNSFIFCYHLADYIEELKKENSHFVYRTTVFDREKECFKKYSTEEFLNEYEQITFSAPNFRVRTFLDEEVDLDRLQNHDYVSLLLQQIEVFSSLKADWDFIAPGTKMHFEDTHSNVERKKYKNTDKEMQYRNIRRCKLFLESSNYLFRIVGKNLFDGYIGYIYPNGNVIFEKFYRNFTTCEIALGNATYQMRFDNFLELSRAQCLYEVIQYKDSLQVAKINHDHKKDLRKWFSRITALMQGSELQQEVTEYVRRLMNEKKIHS